MQNINLPAGAEDEAFLRDHQALLQQAFKAVNVGIGAETDLSYETICSILSYAHVAEAAHALADAAATAAAATEFDPDEFGRRCAAIAKEQNRSVRFGERLAGPSLGANV
jgi:hypothetical protein